MADLNTRLDDLVLAVFDVETTGLRPTWGDRVCEVAVLRCQGDVVLEAYQTLVNPQRPVGRGAFAVHGIPDSELEQAPLFAEVVDEILARLEGAVFVGHNAPFDLGFLASELAHVGLPMPRLIALDTLRLAQALYPFGSHSLGNLCRYLGIDLEGGEHRAMADAFLTWQLFQRLSDALWRRGVRTLGDALLYQGGAIHYERPEPLDIPEPIREALRNRWHLHLLYRSESGQITERLVRPLDVARRGSVTVLVAHCLLRDAQRTFRLDRILRLELVENLE